MPAVFAFRAPGNLAPYDDRFIPQAVDLDVRLFAFLDLEPVDQADPGIGKVSGEAGSHFLWITKKSDANRADKILSGVDSTFAQTEQLIFIQKSLNYVLKIGGRVFGHRVVPVRLWQTKSQYTTLGHVLLRRLKTIPDTGNPYNHSNQTGKVPTTRENRTR